MQLRSFSRWSFLSSLSYHIRKFGGRGPKAEIFWKSVQNDEICRENFKKLGVKFFSTKHKSSHNFSTRHFDDKVTSDLDFLAHLASKTTSCLFLRCCIPLALSLMSSLGPPPGPPPNSSQGLQPPPPSSLSADGTHLYL